MHNSKMLIFGGWDGNQTLSDILEYNLVSNQWDQVEAKGTIKGRYRHSAASNDKAMYVFGGIDQQQERFNDIHEFMFGTSTWSRVITIGNTPSKRTFHQSVMYANAYFYVIGGFDG
jgi:N-acetylneuraminic acid mutarotase